MDLKICHRTINVIIQTTLHTVILVVFKFTLVILTIRQPVLPRAMLDIVDVGSDELIAKCGSMRPSTIAKIIFELSIVDISRSKLVNSTTTFLILFEVSSVDITVGCCQFTFSMSTKSTNSYTLSMHRLEITITLSRFQKILNM
jgi:hypothetical protein